ncbi:MAG: hypothetical protein JWL98_1343 [Xanthomonadaceae bacterium]|nr:hypothetical protein [Xanthomonadaceae bacterium]
MNGNYCMSRLTAARNARALTLSPTTRAIRIALASSATVLALVGSGVAYAGTCAISASNTVACNGVFTDTLPGSLFVPTADLTLVVGDTLPTSVIPAAGAVGVDATWGGNVGVITHADITTDGADGIHEYGSTSATLNNDGHIATNVTAAGVQAMDISAFGDVTVVNTGDILAYGTGANDVTAVMAHSSDGNVALDNLLTGTITANAQDGNAIAVDAFAYLGSVDLSNNGAIVGSSVNGTATGLSAYAEHGQVNVTSDGSIVVSSSAVVPYSYYTHIVSAMGVFAEGLDGVTVSNAGSIGVDSTDGDIAIGIYAASTNGIVSVTNTDTGTIAVTGNAKAYGVVAGGDVSNAGSINVSATRVYSYPDGTLSGRGYAFGVVADVVDNSGSITIAATGIGKAIYGATVDNSGSITVDAGKVAVGVYASGAGSIVNSGDITATADSGVGQYGGSLGIFSRFDTDITNSGQINTKGFQALGILTNGYGTVSNTGSITASATVSAIGISDTSLSNGEVIVYNVGNITATADDNGRFHGHNAAIGINAVSISANIRVDNSAGIAAVADDTAYGIRVSGAGYANSDITNSGDLSASAILAGYGVLAIGFLGDVAVDNSGSITARANNAPGETDENANVFGSFAYGINTYNTFGNISITNSGAIIAQSYAISDYAGKAMGIVAASFAYNSSAIDIANTGSIVASAESNSSVYGVFSAGVFVVDVGNETVDVANSGVISATVQSDYRSQLSQTRATGIFVENVHGDTTVTNGSTGSITAQASTLLLDSARATGVFAFGYSGATDVQNAGAIAAVASSQASAYYQNVGQTRADGIQVSSAVGTAISVSNSDTGVIVANAWTDHYGVASANGINVYTLAADVAVVNAGSITATAQSGATAYSANVGQITTSNGIVVTDGFGANVAVSNSSTGDITVAASANDFGGAIATGINVYSNYVLSVTNAGSIAVTARADNHFDIGDTAAAIGLLAINNYGNTDIINSSSGSINADASASISAVAQGMAVSGATVTVDSAGAIGATAVADATQGTALATGLVASGGNIAVTLDAGSEISAAASSYDGTAIGLLVAGNAVSASNAGAISAQFTGGAGGRSYGAILLGSGNLSFANSGSITATGSGQTVGVELSSDISTVLTNSGTISGGAAVLAGDSTDSINNVGTIAGAIFTNGGNDTLTNGADGIWYAGGTSDFGSGADTIINAGTIVLNNSSIAMGDSDTFANAFDNSGTIFSFGDSAIDMGAGNTNAFTNTGIIDFRDGLANDILTINGDFAGSGALGVDVSGLNGLGDVLYVNGSVANGSVTAVNTTILDVPTTRTGSVAVVKVSGDSTAANFVLGDVTFNPNQSFLVVTGVGMSSSIDTSNATADVFSVDFDVTGLSDAGTLAASFAPGVQSLMNSQVGTWRQRMGVIDKTKTHGFSLWARTFTDSGTINPGHVASTFGQGGNFTFDQRNDGGEAGADFGINDQFSVGLLAGQARATQHLNQTGIGSTKIDGDTSGVYATWFSPNGFYVDTSFRHMTFDARLDSAAGESRTHGKANTFNVEAGYAFELGDGYKIEPQLQYTRTKVGSADVLEGALTGFTPDGGTSSRGRAGVSVRKSFPTNGSTILTPYLAVSAVHEFDGKNTYAINDTFFGSTSAKGTSTLVEGGLNVQVGKLAVFGGLNWQDGGALKSFTGGQLGVRYSW